MLPNKWRYLLVGLIAALAVACGDDDDDERDTRTYKLEVSDQMLTDPGEVAIDRVRTRRRPVWVVIYDSNEAGDGPGEVLGNSERIRKRTNRTDFTISLDEQPDHQETLYALIHRDNPNDSEFTFGEDNEDQPVEGRNRDTVQASFTVEIDGAEDYAVSASDQTLTDPQTVQINSITTGYKDAWIVIHEQNQAGNGPGEIIGTSDFISADSEESDVSVSLDRNATDGETLYAMLHFDDPADGEFTFGTNSEDPAIDIDGELVIDSFVVTVEGDDNYAVSASNQTLTNPNEVTIDSVTTGEEDAWIVIHEQNQAGDNFGDVIGHSSLISSQTQMNDVAVTLDRAAEDGETLYAMLHFDDPADGEYTFGQAQGEDAPIQIDGEIVLDSFDVTVEAEPDYTVSASNQTLSNPLEVNIGSVTTGDQDAWIVIHEQNQAGTNFGDVIGHSNLIPSGAERSNVTVPLDRMAEDGETLYAMLHFDDPNDGEYTFGTGSEDAPIEANGEIVLDTFDVTVETGTEFGVSAQDQDLTNPLEITLETVTTGGQDTWIVIHEENQAGDGPGDVIGHSQLIEANSEMTNVSVSLDRVAEDGETLYAMVHADDPDDGEFNFGTDSEDAPIEVGGETITDSFTVTVPSSTDYAVSAQDQTLSEPTDVVINSVKAGDQDIWLTIHEQNQAGDDFGDLIGQTNAVFQADSTNTDVTVTLDREAQDGETLYAILHYDDPADGAFNFGQNGDDQPVEVDDTVIMDVFTVSISGTQ